MSFEVPDPTILPENPPPDKPARHFARNRSAQTVGGRREAGDYGSTAEEGIDRFRFNQ